MTPKPAIPVAETLRPAPLWAEVVLVEVDLAELEVDAWVVLSVRPPAEAEVAAAEEPPTEAPATSAETVALKVPLIPVRENLAEKDW